MGMTKKNWEDVMGRRHNIAHGLAVGLVGFMLHGQAASQQILKLATTTGGQWDTSIPEIGQKAGIFKKHGLTLEILYTNGGAEAQQAVISGSVDLAVAAGVTTVVGAFGKGAPVRIISGEMTGSSDLYWYVPVASPIQNAQDAAGKTIGYSVAGSSSHAALLEVLNRAGVNAKPTSTGAQPATLTQVMSGQIDVGWAAAPFGLDQLSGGKTRIVFQGSDAVALRDRTTRVNIASVSALASRKDAITRFLQGYRETVDWMYSDPNALKVYAEVSRLPVEVAQRARDFFPRESLRIDRITGLDDVVADAVRFKFLPAPLTKEQLAELVQIPDAVK